jgi:hypothetical protein
MPVLTPAIEHVENDFANLLVRAIEIAPAFAIVHKPPVVAREQVGQVTHVPLRAASYSDFARNGHR